MIITLTKEDVARIHNKDPKYFDGYQKTDKMKKTLASLDAKNIQSKGKNNVAPEAPSKSNTAWWIGGGLVAAGGVAGLYALNKRRKKHLEEREEDSRE